MIEKVTWDEFEKFFLEEFKDSKEWFGTMTTLDGSEKYKLSIGEWETLLHLRFIGRLLRKPV